MNKINCYKKFDYLVSQPTFIEPEDCYHCQGVFLNDNSFQCQRAIYIADILKRFVVANPSLLKEMCFSRLRELFYSKEDYLICI